MPKVEGLLGDGDTDDTDARDMPPVRDHRQTQTPHSACSI
jgi:hypothetical protein